jgi:hypothetical protein
MPENDAPLNLDSLYADLNAEFASAPDTLPTAADTPAAPTPDREGESAPSGAAAEAKPDVPPTGKPATTSEEAPKPTAPPKKAEGPKAEESDLEARLRKAENDLALAKKGQAAEARRANALEQARQLEAQRIHDLAQQGRLTQEEVERGPQLMQGWVQKSEAEAQEAEAESERQRLTAADAQARDEREATLAFKEQALPLAAEMLALGLSPDDANYEQLLQDTLASDAYAPDVALTWKLKDDPAEAARVYERLMTAAKADVKQELTKIAAAKKETEGKKAAAGTYDRTSSPGPSTGGPDIIPDMPLDDMWSRIEWK